MAGFKQKVILVGKKHSVGEFTDKSNDVESISYEGDQALVKFRKSPTVFKYNPGKIYELELRVMIDPALSNIYVNGVLQSDIELMGSYGKCYGILYKNRRTPVFYISNAVVIKRDQSKTILSYFADVAELIKDNKDEKPQEYKANNATFLSSQLKKIINPPGTVLEYYLKGLPIKTYDDQEEVVYPFAINLSQKEAIRKALQHNISIIQGPPGTGKTQSILNLIANLVYRGKTVGIVSNNNSAIENVKEKLEKENYGFLVAHLGNKENQTAFFENPDTGFVPDVRWKQNEKNIKSYSEKLNQINTRIDKLLFYQEELAKCREILSRLEHENKHFLRIFEKSELPAEYRKLNDWDSKKLIDFKAAIIHFPEKMRVVNIPLYFSLRIRYGKLFDIGRKNIKYEDCLSIDELIYSRKSTELNTQIREMEAYIKANNLNDLLKESSELSAILLKNSLYKKYSVLKNETFTQQDFKDKFPAFTARFPVIFSTTHSVLNSVPEPLDYIIIDESSQVDIITASLAFSACRNVVIVGDTQQLPHIVNDTVREEAQEIAGRLGISDEYDYCNNNIIRSLEMLYRDSTPRTLLREHYRCNPLIIGFCNRKYYKGQLVIMKDHPKSGYGKENYPVKIFRTVEGNHERGKVNDRQISIIKEEILPEYNGMRSEEIGIITPYRKQADKINDEICKGNGIEADTIHKFQGREKDIVIFSTVSNEINDFIDKPELINVAVSRAVDQFIMVMPYNYELKHGSNIGDLKRYIDNSNPYGMVDSKIISCFDILYREHSQALDLFKRRIKGSSVYQSENIIETLLNEILDETPAYAGFDFQKGYPLYLMIRDMNGLNDREVAFCRNVRSHVDFLITNRCDNSIILAIEVDGYAFHSNEKQQERDAIKEKALALNNIELLRLPTQGDREKEKIIEKLNLILPVSDDGYHMKYSYIETV